MTQAVVSFNLAQARLATLAFRLRRKLAYRCGIRFPTRAKQFARFTSLSKSTTKKVMHFDKRVTGVEPVSPDWQPGVIAVIRYPHQKYVIDFLSICQFSTSGQKLSHANNIFE